MGTVSLTVEPKTRVRWKRHMHRFRDRKILTMPSSLDPYISTVR